VLLHILSGEIRVTTWNKGATLVEEGSQKSRRHNAYVWRAIINFIMKLFGGEV
jgi:hypothetical protein